MEKHVFGFDVHTGYWSSWMFAAADRARANALVQRYLHRPAVELYHTTEDPAQLNNLAGSRSHEDVERRLRRMLEEWRRNVGDPGAAMDTREALEARRQAAQQWQTSSND